MQTQLAVGTQLEECCKSETLTESMKGEKMARYLLELDMRLLTITFKMLHSYKLGTISDQKEKNPVK